MRWRVSPSSEGRSLRGHTLVEAMVAGSVLIIGLFGTISAIRNGAAIQSNNHHMTTALHAAEKTMEELLLLPDDASELALGSHIGPRYNVNGIIDTTGEWRTAWNVGAGPVTGTKLIVLTVSWSAMTGRRSLTFRTFR